MRTSPHTAHADNEVKIRADSRPELFNLMAVGVDYCWNSTADALFPQSVDYVPKHAGLFICK
jgi:hypothetical protein